MAPRKLRYFICVGSLVLAASCLSAQAETTPQITERYRLEEHGGGLGVFVDEAVVILAVESKSKNPEIVLERWRRDSSWCGQKTGDGKCGPGVATAHEWATSSDCPELNPIIEGLGDLKETGREKPSIMTTDTPLITLKFAPFDADGKSKHVMREYSGPLASWWLSRESYLKRCWMTTPPVIDGYSLKPRLTGEYPQYRRPPSFGSIPPVPELFGPGTYRQPWMKNARKWY